MGGRYSGNLKPTEIENTVTGGPNAPDVEIVLMKTGVFKRPARTGPGVDALQHENLASVYNEFLPHAVVFDGQWHECNVIPVEASARRLGLDITIPTDKLEAERAVVTRWVAKFEALMKQVPAESWISVIDCHW